MAYWRIAYFLAVVVRLTQSRCLFCQSECHNLPTSLLSFDNVTLSCEKADHQDLLQFIESSNFSNVRHLILKSPTVSSLNFTKFYNVSYLDFSRNNISSFNLSLAFNTNFFNLSNNSLETFVGIFPELSDLDLSNNLLKNISWNISNTQKLMYLHLQNNNIKNISTLSLTNLKYFNVQKNKLTQLRIGKCPNLKELDVSSNVIREIYKNISQMIPNVEILNLSSNALQELKDYSFNLTNLLKLDLQNNSISILSQNCFYGLNRLQFLDISLNKIQTVAPSTFQYLNGLIHLLISQNNEMNSQDFGLLLATRRLKSVDASRTNQKKIPSSLTRSVRYLVLSYNIISQIQCGDLDSYPLLNSLNLANNNISYIEDDALGRLDFLITLNLDENYLSTVPHTLPNNLKNLFLRNNKIKSINGNDFVELQQLMQLDLSFNEITKIKEDSFAQLFNLEKLNMSGNNIINLPNSFTGLRKLKILDLSFLINLTSCEQTICFPVPEYNNLQELHMKNSSNLVKIFMKDVAALKTFKQLTVLNIANSNVTELRKDLPTYLPRLNELYLYGNTISCGVVKDIFTWFVLKEVRSCVFIINEDHSKEQISTTFKYNTQINITTEKAFTTATPLVSEDSRNNFTTTIPTYENKSVIDNVYSDFFSNDLWFKNDSPGMVDAYSAETPTSHPGLLILLVLPIAVVATCLFLNYTRAKKTRTHSIHSEMDIEISNISSELW